MNARTDEHLFVMLTLGFHLMITPRGHRRREIGSKRQVNDVSE